MTFGRSEDVDYLMHRSHHVHLVRSQQSIDPHVQYSRQSVLSRRLKPEDFGRLAIAFVFVTMARTLGHRSIASALIQRHDLTDRHIAAGLTLSAAAGAGFAAALRGAAPAVGSLFGEPAVGPVLAALSLVLVKGRTHTRAAGHVPSARPRSDAPWSRNQRYVPASPGRSPILARQPSPASRLVSRSIRGAPSGFEPS